jgi:hypothetical protein
MIPHEYDVDGGDEDVVYTEGFKEMKEKAKDAFASAAEKVSNLTSPNKLPIIRKKMDAAVALLGSAELKSAIDTSVKDIPKRRVVIKNFFCIAWDFMREIENNILNDGRVLENAQKLYDEFFSKCETVLTSLGKAGTAVVQSKQSTTTQQQKATKKMLEEGYMKLAQKMTDYMKKRVDHEDDATFTDVDLADFVSEVRMYTEDVFKNRKFGDVALNLLKCAENVFTESEETWLKRPTRANDAEQMKKSRNIDPQVIERFKQQARVVRKDCMLMMHARDFRGGSGQSEYLKILERVKKFLDCFPAIPQNSKFAEDKSKLSRSSSDFYTTDERVLDLLNSIDEMLDKKDPPPLKKSAK